MVALSRLKATSEAWKTNFRGLSLTFWPKYENMGSRLAKEWHVVTAPPCEAHKGALIKNLHQQPQKELSFFVAVGANFFSTPPWRTELEPLPKMYALQYTPPKATWDCGKCTSKDHLSQRVLRMLAIWSWSGKKTSFFGKWRWPEHRRMNRAIHWFLYNKFNVDLVDTLRAFKAAACLVCPATAPLLNATPASVHWPQQLRTFPLMRTSSWMACARSTPAYGIPCSCGKCLIQSWQHGRSGCQESRVG